MDGFKKIASTDTHHIYQHPDGHILQVNFAKVPNSNEKLRPNSKAEGGKVDKMKVGDVGGDIGEVKDQETIDQGGYTPMPANATSDAPAQSYADGGEVSNPEDIHPMPTADDLDKSNIFNQMHSMVQMAATPGDPAVANPVIPQPVAQPAQGLPSMPSGFDEALKGYNQLIGGTQAAGQAAANVQESQGIVAGKQAGQQNELMQHYQAAFNEKQKELESFQNDIKNQHIDPNRYLANKDTIGKLGTAIGMILGGAGSGLTGGENPVMKFVSQQIDRDIEAQKMDLGRKNNLLQANLSSTRNLQDATAMTSRMMHDMFASELEAAGAKSKSDLAKANAQQAVGQARLQYGPQLPQMAMQSALQRQMAGQQGGQSSIAPGDYIRMMVPQGKDNEEATKEMGLSEQNARVHQTVDNLINGIAAKQQASQRLMHPFQAPKEIAAMEAQLIPLIQGVAPSKRLTPEVVQKEIEPFMPGIATSDPTTVENLRNQLHNLIDTHAAGEFPTLEKYRVPNIPKYRPAARTIPTKGR